MCTAKWLEKEFLVMLSGQTIERAIEEMQETEDEQEERAEKVNLGGKKEINTMEEK